MLTFTNAKLFDGREMLPGRRSVAIDGNRIVSVTAHAATAHAATGHAATGHAGGSERAIDLDGMTLMPGLITCHLHADFFRFTLAQGLASEPLGKEFPPGVMMAIGVRTCRVLLESGFTGYVGASCSNDVDAQLKMAIAEGIIAGPRIRACSHHIGTTADLNDSRKWWRRFETPGTDLFVDGPDAMRKAVREEIRRGAETIKIFASSGRGYMGRTHRNMGRDEITAIVRAAHERGVKVRAHVAGKEMILECVELGVDVIDHGDELDEQCIEAMAKAGTFWVPSLVYPKVLLELGWGDAAGLMQSLYDNSRRMLPLAQAAGIRILVGDDYSGVFRDTLQDDPLDHQVGRYGREFAYYGAIEGLSAAAVLGWGTKNAGELLVDAPGKLGLVEPGALADLIVVDGDPLADLTLLARPEQTLRAVIRDGVFAIDRLPPYGRRMAA
ncbi:MAG TPA: amidohydrolase family protein [Steroidobacteraceae bacterium]|nr:amidohydrolase family protein [Steroidobacteraceae bacterium]